VHLKNVKAYLDLCRVSNLPTVWTNVLAGVILSDGVFPGDTFLLLGASLSLFYSGGMCLNDICDRKVDVQKRPSRPIPSGRISLTHAWFFTSLLFLAALCLLAAAPHRSAMFPGLLLLAVIVGYDTLHKASYPSVLLMAACRLLIFVVCSVGVTGALSLSPTVAGLIQFCYVLLISVVARQENSRARPFLFPVVPSMIAGISLLDGIVLAAVASPAWLAAGLVGMVLTLLGQKYVRGD